MGVPGAVACLGHVPATCDWVSLACAGEPRVGARPVTVSYKSGAGATVQDTTTSGGSHATASASANAGEAPYCRKSPNSWPVCWQAMQRTLAQLSSKRCLCSSAVMDVFFRIIYVVMLFPPA